VTLSVSLLPNFNQIEELSARMKTEEKTIADLKDLLARDDERGVEGLWVDILPYFREEELVQADEEGRTIFHKACASGNVKMIEALLDHCPQLMETSDKHGFLPHHLAPKRESAIVAMPSLDKTEAELFWMGIEGGFCPPEMKKRVQDDGYNVQEILELLRDSSAIKSLDFVIKQLEYFTAVQASHNFPLKLDQEALFWVRRIHTNFQVVSSYIKLLRANTANVFDKEQRTKIRQCMKLSAKLVFQMNEMERLGRKRPREEALFVSKQIKICSA